MELLEGVCKITVTFKRERLRLLCYLWLAEEVSHVYAERKSGLYFTVQ